MYNIINSEKDKLFVQLLLSPEERVSLSNTKSFKESNKFWNSGRFNSIDNVGSMNNILKKIHNNWITKNEGYIDKEYFVREYVKSGIDRNIILEEKQMLNTKTLNSDFGRTFGELYDIALMFSNYINVNTGKTLDIQRSVNFVYIRIFDQTYNGYKREYDVYKLLSQKYRKSTNIIKADSLIDSSYAVDFIVEDKTEKIIGAIQLKPNSYNFIGNKESGNHKSLNNYKHSLFEDHYGIKPVYMFYDQYNNLVNEEDIMRDILKK